MDFNSITAGIRMIGNSVTKLQISNEIVDLGTEAQKSFGLFIHKPQKESSDVGFMYSEVISIEVHIGDEFTGKTSLIMDIEGAFESVGTISEENFKTLVALNGASALLGIARGKIEAISSVIYNTGKITIPLVNMIEYYKEISKEKAKGKLNDNHSRDRSI
jgi:hypothetical protein